MSKKGMIIYNTPIFSLKTIQNELETLVLLENTSYNITYDPLVLNYSINISSGIYKNRSVSFDIHFPPQYPFESPKIKCLTPVVHPSIDEEGNTCLEILRLNWKCTYGIQNILINLYTIFTNLECDTPLNDKVSKLMEEDWDEFVKQAKNR